MDPHLEDIHGVCAREALKPIGYWIALSLIQDAMDRFDGHPVSLRSQLGTRNIMELHGYL